MDALEIDPMSAASPDMSAADTTALQESIAKLGQLVPIVMWRGKIIDGRKRLAACVALGVEPRVVEIPEAATATDYAGALNLLRTHYTLGQRAMYAATLASAPVGFRPDRDRSGVGNSLHLTIAEAAERAGVHRSDVANAKHVRKHAAPEVAAAVERGDLSLMSATRIVRSVPRDQQSATVRRAKEAKGHRKALPAGTIKAPAFKALPKRDAIKVIGKCLANMEAQCDVLDDYADRLPAMNGERAAWLASLDTISATLRRFRRRLKGEVADEG